MKKLVFLSIVFFLTNCATYHQLMVGPDGTIQDCAAYGQGLFGMMGAQNITNSCRDNLKKAGYIEIEKAGVVGIKLKSDNSMEILQVMPNSPAEKAGLQPGYKLIMVDSLSVSTSSDALSLLIGEKETSVVLTIVNKKDTTNYNLKRAPYISIYGKP